MVVPVRTSINMEKVKECVGNNQKLDIDHNKKTLIVVGNNCRIQLSENSGLVRVVGNTCELSVQKGNGNIEYVGNQGKIILGSSIPEANVSYIGNNGVITNTNNSSKTKVENNTKNNYYKPCDSSKSSSDTSSYNLAANLHISSCNNVTVSNGIETTAPPDLITVTIPQIRTNIHKCGQSLFNKRTN